MASVHHTKLAPTSYAATDSAVGYPPENIDTEEISREYRSTSAGAKDVDLLFAAPQVVATLFVHAVNFASANVETYNGSVWTPVGTLTTYANERARRRGQFNVNASGVRGIRLKIAAGAPTDGAAFWRTGAAYAFGVKEVLPVAPGLGYTVRTELPQVSKKLPNGRTARARTGDDLDRIEVQVNRQYTQSLATLISKAELSTVLFSMDVLSHWPAQQWPVQILEDDSPEQHPKKKRAVRSFVLTEIC